MDEIRLMITLLGGFGTALFLAIPPLCPIFRGVPGRWAMALAGMIPATVLVGMGIGELLAQGHTPLVLLAMSPVGLAIGLSVLVLVAGVRHKSLSRSKRRKLLIYNIVLLASILWAVGILWNMADSCFMGACC